MHKRSFFLTLALGVLVWGLGAMDARAGYVSLPTTLDTLLGGTLQRFPPAPSLGQGSNCPTSRISSPSSPAALIVPSAPAVNVTGSTVDTGGPISLPPGELGVQFQIPISATAGQAVDVLLSYTVTALNGFKIHDVFLAGNPATTGNGLASVTETVSSGGVNVLPVSSLLISAAGTSTDGPVNLISDQTSIVVQKDIIVNGNTDGSTAQLSFMTQGYSLSAVPEPTSMALLGIGVTGFFAFRRFFRRTAVA